MKAILIARVSTEEQKEMGLSLPAQMARLERYCQNKGFEILDRRSFDESAYSDQRAEFDQIIDSILAQKEKVAVCCDKVDRLSRNMFDKRVSELYKKALRDEIELHFVSDGQVINSQISAAAGFQFKISLGLAEYYSAAISDNVKRANEQKLRRGEWTGKAPYGYKYVPNAVGKKDIVIDENIGPIIQRCFELYASGAFSLELLHKKITADYGVVWAKSYMDKLLNNHFYYGVMVVKGKMYPHCYQPLVSQDLFNQVQAVRKSFNKNHHKYAGRPYLYRGLLRCAECGLAITPEKHKGFVYYHCTQYKGKHGATWIREEDITDQLGDVFKRLQMPEEILQQTLETLNEVHTNKMEFHNRQFATFTKELNDLTTMMDALYMDKLKGRISDAEYERFYKKFCTQRDDVTLRLSNLQSAESSYYVTAKYILDLSKKAYELFKSSEVEQKRHLIQLVLSNLKLSDGNIVYEAQKPFDMMLECSDRLLWRPQGDSNPCYRNENPVS